MNTQYRKNLKAVATACKNYTDEQIAESEERMKWYIGEYQTTTQDDNTTAYQKTVPANATRVKIKRIYGNTLKYNPSVASDTTVAFMKTLPDIVYTLDVSYVYGASEVSENLIVLNDVAETLLDNGITYSIKDGVITLNGTANNGKVIYLFNNKTFNIGTCVAKGFVSGTTTQTSQSVQLGSQTLGRFLDVKQTTTSISYSGGTIANDWYCAIVISNGSVYTNYKVGIMLVSGSTEPTEFKVGFNNIHNFAWNGVKVEGANKLGNHNLALFGNNRYILTTQNVLILPNTTYTFSNSISNGADGSISILDESLNVIQTIAQSSANKQLATFTTLSNAKYFKIDRWYMDTTTFTIESAEVMLNVGSALPYEPYVSQTLPIDLTSIEDSGGNKLFADGSLKGVGNVADEITPYKAIKRFGKFIVTEDMFDGITRTGVSQIDSANFIVPLLDSSLAVKTYPLSSLSTIGAIITSTSGNYWSADNTISLNVRGSAGYTLSYVKSGITEAQARALCPFIVQYEIATPIEVSIDWSATLRGIQGYSKGTITLQNTYNMDTANTITYNSMIKENCCSKIVQTRGGNVVKTINLPTQASDGWSAGSASNVRDFTTNKRETNVDKDYLGNFNYIRRSDLTDVNCFSSNELTDYLYSNVVNALCSKYTFVGSVASYVAMNDKGDKCFALYYSSQQPTNRSIYANDSDYTDATTFKTAMTNEPLYYELADASKTETDITAIDNIIEVQPNDVLSFYNSDDELVTIPSDLTYRIEVARV